MDLSRKPVEAHCSQIGSFLYSSIIEIQAFLSGLKFRLCIYNRVIYYSQIQGPHLQLEILLLRTFLVFYVLL